MKSIIQSEKKCFFCQSPHVEEHHLYFGAKRKLSEKYGLKVWLCPAHHRTGPVSPHRNREVDLELKMMGQRKFEETHTREEFMRIFGRNYLDW